uniref:Uncharacterized protein n=1 Tax=viral metagenome TaxID=1070528 RepID=A0A6C0HV32_9ZZZZ
MFIPKSFYYFKLGILFYILCKMNNIKSRKTRLILFNKISEFNKNEDIFEKIYKYIFKRQNCLIFTNYMQLPNIFQPIPSELIYYKPLITFYKNHNINSDINDLSDEFSILDKMDKFYTDRIRIQENKTQKWIFRYIQDQHIFPDTTTVSIPIDNNMFNYLDNFIKKEKDVLYLIYYDNIIYIGRRTNSNKFKITHKKKLDGKYVNYNTELIVHIDKLLYIMALLPITKQELMKTFDMSIIKKETVLYHNRSDDLRENIIRYFYALKPDINLIDPFGLFKDNDYYCFTYKLKKDVSVINLNKDVFYHDLFDDKAELNYNIIKDYGNKNTWERNKGKRMLMLIIYKTSLFWLDKTIYYPLFLAHYDIDAFIYHYGYFKGKLLETELGFCKDADKYVSYISMKKGACN